MKQLARRSVRLACAAMALLAAPLSGLAECTVSSTGVDFGSYDSLSAQDTEITGDIEVDCSVQSSYVISLDTGSGTYASRLMADGTETLMYNLYVDPARQIVWGDGSAGTQTVSDTGTGTSHTVYGRIPAHQSASAGIYGDSITILLTF